MHRNARGHTRRADLGLHLDVRQKPFRYRVKRIRRPLCEPVNGAAVNQARELPEAAAEGVSDRAEGQHNVQVRLAALHKKLILLRRSVELAIQLLGGAAALFSEQGLFVGSKQIGDLACIEQVVDVLHKRFQLNLGVSKEKYS